MTVLERFEEKFVPVTESGCWLWTAAILRGGYGAFKINGMTGVAHRISFELYVGDIPEGLYVLHKCDIPSCVNPDHLFLGTHQDNMDDMRRKGRSIHAFGADHGRSKLTEKQILAIRKDKRILREIAADYGVGKAQISSIKRLEFWKHI